MVRISTSFRVSKFDFLRNHISHFAHEKLATSINFLDFRTLIILIEFHAIHHWSRLSGTISHRSDRFAAAKV